MTIILFILAYLAVGFVAGTVAVLTDKADEGQDFFIYSTLWPIAVITYLCEAYVDFLQRNRRGM